MLWGPTEPSGTRRTCWLFRRRWWTAREGGCRTIGEELHRAADHGVALVIDQARLHGGLIGDVPARGAGVGEHGPVLVDNHLGRGSSADAFRITGSECRGVRTGRRIDVRHAGSAGSARRSVTEVPAIIEEGLLVGTGVEGAPVERDRNPPTRGHARAGVDDRGHIGNVHCECRQGREPGRIGRRQETAVGAGAFEGVLRGLTEGHAAVGEVPAQGREATDAAAPRAVEGDRIPSFPE